jgi:hypothetical protein
MPLSREGQEGVEHTRRVRALRGRRDTMILRIAPHPTSRQPARARFLKSLRKAHASPPRPESVRQQRIFSSWFSGDLAGPDLGQARPTCR